MTRRLAVADMVVALVPLVVVGLSCRAPVATDWTNWSFAYALAVVLVASAVLRPLGVALVV